MTTGVTDSPDTALTLLFGREDPLDVLSHAIESAGTTENLDRVLGKLPPATRAAAAREATTAAAGLLDINLIDLLLTGWREYQDLTSAARRTLVTPRATELVNLVTHRVSLSRQPYVAILVDGHQVATVRLGISVVFDIGALSVRIRGGRLAGVLTGSCDVSATLTIDDIEVISKQSHLNLPGEVALRQELRLLPAEDYPASEDKPALTMHERNLPVMERVLGGDHPNTPGTRGNLANAHQDAGRTAEAIAKHERNLADVERVLGSDHPDTLSARANLANAYQDAGRTAEAIALHERNLADMKRVLGGYHPDTLRTQGNLARVRQETDRTDGWPRPKSGT